MGQVARAVENAIESILKTGVGGEYDAEETETRHYPAPSELRVETVNGGVTVRGEDREDVEVVVTKRATDAATLERARAVAVGGDGEPLSLRAEYDGPPGDVAVEFEVALPTGVPVERVETKNGSVELRDATGDAELETVNGSITAERADGYLDVRTTNGKVTAREVTGIDHAESTNGSLELEFDDLRRDAAVETRSGSVTVLADDGLDAEVAISTSVGSIDAPALGRSASGVGKLSVGGTLGDGGPRLGVETRLGSVELRRRDSESELD